MQQTMFYINAGQTQCEKNNWTFIFQLWYIIYVWCFVFISLQQFSDDNFRAMHHKDHRVEIVWKRRNRLGEWHLHNKEIHSAISSPGMLLLQGASTRGTVFLMCLILSNTCEAQHFSRNSNWAQLSSQRPIRCTQVRKRKEKEKQSIC